ncbi:Uncharacterised protein [Raoultella terrigena]|uniref:Uncharacterized protein n=1 Tax=Raoultella terrigena TaxID=577 RepID=A0A485CF34_RAOTE|nr:Uncharacterised protein [Raoultella terrigena]
MVYQTLLAQGLRIPQDVAVVGYDNMVGIGDLFFTAALNGAASAL